METLNELKASMSTEIYSKSFSRSKELGTPEGVQKQFDNLREFPGWISYLDLVLVEGVKRPVEIVSVLVDADGTILEQRTEDRVLVTQF